MYKETGSKVQTTAMEIGLLFHKLNVSPAEGMAALCMMLGNSAVQLGLKEEDVIKSVSDSMRVVYTSYKSGKLND